jgi:hypothetical protein
MSTDLARIPDSKQTLQAGGLRAGSRWCSPLPAFKAGGGRNHRTEIKTRRRPARGGSTVTRGSDEALRNAIVESFRGPRVFCPCVFFTTDNTDRSAPDKSTAMQTHLSVPGGSPALQPPLFPSSFSAERQVCIVVALSGGPIRVIRGKIREILVAAPPRSEIRGFPPACGCRFGVGNALNP